MTIRRVVTVTSIALLGVGVLAGCSSSTSSTSSTSAAASSAASAAASTAATASGTASMLPPIIVTDGQKTAEAKVGDFIDIVVKKPAGTTIDTDKPNILEVSQAHQDGSAVFNPGAKALAPGDATIIVTNPDGSTWDIAVTVSPK
jgi:hypothetical protein